MLAWTWPTVHGPKPVPYDVHLDGVNSRVKAGDSYEVVSETIKNPVTGAEVHPGATLPEGIVFKEGDFGSSTTFRVSDEIAYEHPGKYTAVGPVRVQQRGPRRERAPATTPAPTSRAATRRRRGHSNPEAERMLGLHHLVDLRRAFVDDRRARITEVTLDPVLRRIAVRAVHLDRQMRRAECGLRGMPLRK